MRSSPRDTRRLRARIFWLHDKPLTTGASILVRLGTRETRATVVAIEKAVDPGELSSVETKSIARNHVGEIDISLAQPLAADAYTDNPRTGRLVIEVNGRIAGGGLVLSVDAGQRAASGRYRAGGIRVASRRALGALSPQRRGGLADRSAGLRQIDAGARAGTPAVRQWRLAGPARRRYAARRPQQRSRFLRRRIAARTFAGWRKSRLISRATATSPSSPRSRPRAKTVPRRAASPTPRSARSMSRPRPKSARAAIPRAITPRRGPARCTRSPALATTTSRRRDSELTIDTSTRSVAEATDEIERMLAGSASCSTNSSISAPISRITLSSGVGASRQSPFALPSFAPSGPG